MESLKDSLPALTIEQNDYFATPIYNISAACMLHFCKPSDILDWTIEHRTSDPDGRTVSNVGGYQSNDIVNKVMQDESQPIIKLFDSVIAASQLIRDEWNVYKGRNLTILGSWFNVNRSTFDSNSFHVHPGCWLAATYYPERSEGGGQLLFKDPRPQHIMSLDDRSEPHTQHTNITVNIEPDEGQLFLFPAWLEHGVSNNHNQAGNRTVIAMNVGVV
jgi:uncharacterized protein (TIGR02466 family)